MKKRGVFLLFVLLLTTVSIVGSEENKVDSQLLERLQIQDSVGVIVQLKEEPVKIFGLFDTKNPREEVNKKDFKKKYDYSLSHSFSGVVNKEGLRQLIKNPNVENVYLDKPYRLHLTDSVVLINATKVTALQLGGINVTGDDQTICILDTGINYTHNDFGGCTSAQFLSGLCNGITTGNKLVRGYDYVNDDNDPMDGQGHGTHVAGIVAANGTVKGVAYGANIVAIKVCDDSGQASCLTSDVYAGFEWCINNASIYNISVISMSFGSETLYTAYCDNVDSIMTDYVNSAIARNISVVASTGNDGSTTGIGSPACIKNVTSVGATTKSDSILYNRNNITDLLAPGQSINSTYYDGKYAVLSGTSMSTPHVSGAIALLQHYNKLENNFTLLPSEAQSALNRTGLSIADSGSGLTFHRIDVLRALWSIDMKKPAISAWAISPAVVYNYSDVVFFVNATDTNLAFVWLELNNSGNTTKFLVENKDDNRYNFTVAKGNFTPNSFVEWRFGANDTNNNVNYTDWANFTVQSSMLVITLYAPANNSYFNSVGVTFNFTATDDRSLFLNCTFEVDGFDNATNSTTNNGTLTSYRLNLTELIHNWGVFCIDNSSNNVLSSLWWFTIDVTNPQITNLTANSTIELGDTQTIMLNVTEPNINYVNISYEGLNKTMTVNGTTANYSFITTRNGTLLYLIYALDLAANLNVTNGSFIVNDSAPEPRLLTPKLFNSTITRNNKQEVSVLVLDADNISSVLLNFNETSFMVNSSLAYNYTYSWNTTSCGATNYTIEANDSYNNIKRIDFNFSVIDCCGNAICEAGESCSSCSSDCGNCPTLVTSGGGGGGGGGVTTPLNKITNLFSYVTPAGSATSKISREEFEVTAIKLEVLNDVKSAKITVERLENKPEEVNLLPRAYKYLKIEKANIADENLKRVIVSFKVNRSWIGENGFNKSLVRLYRFTDKWEELTTVLVNQTAEHFFYDAETTAFSYFAIGVKEQLQKFYAHKLPAENGTITGETVKVPEKVENKSELIEESRRVKLTNYQLIALRIVLITALITLVVWKISKLRYRK